MKTREDSQLEVIILFIHSQVKSLSALWYFLIYFNFILNHLFSKYSHEVISYPIFLILFTLFKAELIRFFFCYQRITIFLHSNESLRFEAIFVTWDTVIVYFHSPIVKCGFIFETDLICRILIPYKIQNYCSPHQNDPMTFLFLILICSLRQKQRWNNINRELNIYQIRKYRHYKLSTCLPVGIEIVPPWSTSV